MGFDFATLADYDRNLFCFHLRGYRRAAGYSSIPQVHAGSQARADGVSTPQLSTIIDEWVRWPQSNDYRATGRTAQRLGLLQHEAPTAF
jgi:hypothetical protein